eukprot:4871862-Pyramimonas_sp.AAC.1
MGSAGRTPRRSGGRWRLPSASGGCRTRACPRPGALRRVSGGLERSLDAGRAATGRGSPGPRGRPCGS